MDKNFNQEPEQELPIGILKINKLLRLGHHPSRGKEHYQAYHKHTGHKTALLANCLMHACFNLTNKQLQQFTAEDVGVLTGHIQNCHQPSTDEIKRSIFDTLKKTGLQVHRSRRKCEIKENQWLIALYFGKDPKFAKVGYLRQDYHFMLKEKDGSWSEKRGFTETVNHHKKPPKKFTDYATGFEYCLEGYYLITNPYAEKTKGQTYEKEI